MRSKQSRKNAHKERIFTQQKNFEDFNYTKSHQHKIDGEDPKLKKEPGSEACRGCGTH